MTPRRPRAAWAALLAAAALAGCASTPAPEPGWTEGRLALSVAATAQRGAQSLSAGFALRGSGDAGTLRLTSALGTTLAEARWAPGLAELTTAQGTARFDTLHALAEQAFGEPLPLAALPDWLAGRPWPGAAHAVADGGFVQLGWTVRPASAPGGWTEARRDAPPPAVRLRARVELPS